MRPVVRVAARLVELLAAELDLRAAVCGLAADEFQVQHALLVAIGAGGLDLLDRVGQLQQALLQLEAYGDDPAEGADFSATE